MHRNVAGAAQGRRLTQHGLMVELSADCRLLLAAQAGVVARWQAPSVGLATAVIDARVRRGRWQPLYRGVYAAFTGPPSRESFLWGAVLRAGPGAALSYDTAAELDGLTEIRTAAIHVTVLSEHQFTPAGRHCPGAPRIIVHQSARLAAALHPARVPPRTRVEETVVDLVQTSASFDEALSWLTAACAGRRTTPAALRRAMGERTRLRWRAALAGALADIGSGVHSVLEYRYSRDVARSHGLPPALRQAPMMRESRAQYLDNLYQEFGVAVELDGQVAHRAKDRRADKRRDNFFTAEGIVTLRYGWTDVTERRCETAAEIGRTLTRHGWAGQLTRCGPACTAQPSLLAQTADPQPSRLARAAQPGGSPVFGEIAGGAGL
jgi:hypothetical protein